VGRLFAYVSSVLVPPLGTVLCGGLNSKHVADASAYCLLHHSERNLCIQISRRTVPSGVLSLRYNSRITTTGKLEQLTLADPTLH